MPRQKSAGSDLLAVRCVEEYPGDVRQRTGRWDGAAPSGQERRRKRMQIGASSTGLPMVRITTGARWTVE